MRAFASSFGLSPFGLPPRLPFSRQAAAFFSVRTRPNSFAASERASFASKVLSSFAWHSVVLILTER